MMNKPNPHIGSAFDAFPADEGVLEETTALAIKRVIAWQIAEAMKVKGLTKKAMAERMRTSRSHLDRLLDESDTGMTIETPSRSALALGYRVKIELAAS